jgi:hypothetical protein
MARIIHGGRSIWFYTATNGTTPTVGSTPVATFTDQISTDVSKDDSGVATITIEQVQDDSTFYAFIRTYAPQSEGGGIEDLLFEDGSQELGNASGTKLVAVVKGGVEVNGTARKGFACMGALSKASGSWSQAGNTYSRPTLVFTSVALQGDLALGTALVSGAMTTAATQTLDSDLDKYGKVFFG